MSPSAEMAIKLALKELNKEIEILKKFEGQESITIFPDSMIELLQYISNYLEIALAEKGDK